MHEATAASAIAWARAGELEDWVHRYLCGEGNNRPFSDGLRLARRRFAPPTRMRLDSFVRCCGPEPGMTWRTDAQAFDTRVEAIAKRFAQGGWDMPPLIVQRRGEEYVLSDGNHRHEALTRLGEETYWVIVWETA